METDKTGGRLPYSSGALCSCQVAMGPPAPVKQEWDRFGAAKLGVKTRMVQILSECKYLPLLDLRCYLTKALACHPSTR